MVDNRNTKLKAAETKVDSQVTAGGVLASAWAYGTTGLELIQNLDDVVARLANVELLGKCKQTKQGGSLAPTLDAFAGIEGCAPYLQSAKNALAAAKKKKTKKGDNKPKQEVDSEVASSLISAVFELTKALSGKPRFPGCMEDQYRKFLSVLPVQYYLLIVLSKLAKQVADSSIIKKEVNTVCGTRLEQTEIFESRLPNFEIPLIPELPYIDIPDFTDFIDNLVSEALCIGLCLATTPIINTVSSVLLDLANQWAEPDETGFYDNYPPLKKILIDPYITEAAIQNTKTLGLAPGNVSNKEIRTYINQTQQNPTIQQEEFIFLFLGQGNCNIVNKILAQNSTLALQSRGVKLNNEQEILTFFQAIGSFINFVEILNKSKADICIPDPCDLKPEQLEGVLSNINNLCTLLNPKLGLPPLPLGALMDAAGVNDFIVDSTYESYKTIPTLNESYQDYINDFYTDSFNKVVPKLINYYTDDSSFIAIGVNNEGVSLSQYGEGKVIIGSGVELTTTVEKQKIIEDEAYNFKKINNSIQKYWLESDDLTFNSSTLLISNYVLEDTQTSLLKSLNGFAKRYLEASYPFAVLSLVSQLIPQNFDFLNFYNGWSKKGQEFKTAESGVNVSFNGFYKYPKELLKSQLQNLQKDSKLDVGDENSLNTELRFASLKKDFGL
tara:strand:+ start:750 stop:2753 length:2004 start_codon:yes stop_codon:yes gene_type:complete